MASSSLLLSISRSSSFMWYQFRVRPLSTLTPPLLKGHAHWQNVKHIKAARDREISLLHQKYSYKIGLAVKAGGGHTDPKLNRSLAKVIEEAQSLNVTKTCIQNAIKRASGQGVQDKEYLVEITGPGRSAILVEAVAPNRQMVYSRINQVLKKNLGAVEPGLAKLFRRAGVVCAHQTAEEAGLQDLDAAEETAIEVDAEEVEEIPNFSGSSTTKLPTSFMFTCDPNHVVRVKGALESKGHTVPTAEIKYLPYHYVALGKKARDANFSLIDQLMEKVEFAVGVHHNIAQPEEDIREG